MAETASLPRPGQPKTVSTIMLPPKSTPVCKPTTVTVGMSALRRAWRITTQNSCCPLARASVT